MMSVKNTVAAVMALATFAGVSATGAMAQDNRQKDKNNMRNIGIAAGAGAAYEALHGKGTHALILGAGAAYAGKKYEDQRKAENKDTQERRASARRYRRGHRTARAHARRA